MGALVAGAAAGAVLRGRANSAEEDAARLEARTAELAARNETLRDDLARLQRRTRVLARDAARARRQARLAAAVNARRDETRGEVQVDLRGWDGLFRVRGTALGYARTTASIAGSIEFLGGAPCALGRVELTGTFVRGGRAVASDVWRAPTLEGGDPTPFLLRARARRGPDRARVAMTDARCAS